MASYKFKVGDIVKGTDPDKYGVTNSHMTRGRVTEIGEDGWLSVKVLEHDEQCWVGHDFYYLNPKYFDLVSSTEKPEFRVGQRVRIRSWESMDKEFGRNGFGNIAAESSFVDHMRPLCGRTATIESIYGKKVTLKDWSNSYNTGWGFSTDMLEPADKFEVGQIYRVGKLSHRREWENAIIKLTGSRPYGFNAKSIRGEAPFDFGADSEYARSLTLLTGPQIGEAIKKYDADHAEKKAEGSGEYTEVNRKANVGDTVRVMIDNGGPVHAGTTWKVDSTCDDGTLTVHNNAHMDPIWSVGADNYIVLFSGKHVYTVPEIAEAKKFVLDTISELAEKSIYILFDGVGHGNDNYTAYIVGKGSATEFDEGDLTISGVKTGESKCSPNDEPNEWVGKAVALCKALGKELPSYAR